MSACDGSGRAIGCPGCQECSAEMEEIDRNRRELVGLTRSLRHLYSSDPWTGEPVEPGDTP